MCVRATTLPLALTAPVVLLNVAANHPAFVQRTGRCHTL